MVDIWFQSVFSSASSQFNTNVTDLCTWRAERCQMSDMGLISVAQWYSAVLLGNKQAGICTSLCHMATVALIGGPCCYQSTSCGTASACLNMACLVVTAVRPLPPLSSSVDQKPPDRFWHCVFHTPLNWTSPLWNLRVQSYLSKAGTQTYSTLHCCGVWEEENADISVILKPNPNTTDSLRIYVNSTIIKYP